MKSKQFAYRLLFIALGLTSLFVWNTTSSQAVPAPVLIKDINTTIKGNDPLLDPQIRTLTAAGSALYFIAYDRAHGNELWKHDASGTAMVKDIVTGTGNCFWNGVNPMVYWNGALYFGAIVPSGYALWKSNGTAETTVEVSHKAWPADIVVFNNSLFYSGDHTNLWTSNGTDEGTLQVKGGISGVYNLTVAGSFLYFTVNNNLWRSDGTEAGTIPLAPGVSVYNLTAVGNTLFFRGNEPVNGRELWRSDGSVAGTTLVADLYPGTGSSDPDYLTNLNGTLYFTAVDNLNVKGLRRCEQAGTPTMVRNDISPVNITNVSGTLFFSHTTDLWKSDGTNGGTQFVRGGCSPSRLFALGSTLYFKGWDTSLNSYELWKSDGTGDGTVMVKDINPGNLASDPELFTNVNGILFFIATEPSTGRQLWRSDGTTGGTVPAANVSPGTSDSIPANFANVGGTVFFGASDGSGAGQHGTELWQTNGTLAGTSMVQDLKAGASNGNPEEITVGNGAVYFVVYDSELWKRVGANAAEVIKTGINPGKLTFVGGLNGGSGLLFFQGYDTTNIYELWKSDGTIAGTVMVKNINPAGSSGISSLTGFNDILYFIATDGTNGNQLWKSDGTSDNTVPVRSDIKDVKYLTRVNSRLYFVGDLYSGGVRVANDALWAMDGAGNITQLTNSDIVLPAELAAVGNTLFFRANATGAGNELWKSNGTPAGTTLVKDVRSGTDGSAPYNLSNVNGTLFFTVWNTWGTPDRIEIWKSDGSDTGTVLVKGLEAVFSNDISLLTSVHGLLAFVFNDQVHGAELWTSDGTDAGTKMVQDIYPDPSGFGSSPDGLTMAFAGTDVQNEALFFSAIDEMAGREIYILDFTPPVNQINPTLFSPYQQPALITFYGTASDSMPGTGVTLVQVSTNNGATWNNAVDTSGNGSWSSWQYIWHNPPEGTHTIRSRAIDLATNVQSPDTARTVRVSVPHTFNIDLSGTGGGTVTVSVNTGVSSIFNTDHSLTVYTFDDVLLVPSRYPYSLFTGWSGVCSGTGNCSYTIPTVAAGGSSHTATATFTYDWPHAVKVLPNNSFYQKISGAYQAATTASGATIRAWGIDFADTLLFNLDKQIILIGGDNEAHNDNSTGITTVPGPVTVQSGSVTVDKITIR